MTEPNATVNYGARPISGDFVVGQVVVGCGVDSNGLPVWTTATLANRTTNGRADGIVITDSANGSPALMVTMGKVDASISGLPAGAATWVRVSATGTLERAGDSPSDGDDVVGRCEANGDFHATFGFITAAMARVA
jgi:hypothetical protein